MAAPKEKLPSLGDLTHMERKTFTKQRDHCLTNSKVRQLQQRWQEIKERELRARQHNKELLQQFEKAQDALTEMLDCTAAMKTIRMEYERYLKESSPRWQQQLKEKTQAAQRMRMEDNLRSCLKNTKEAEVTKAYADQRSQGCIEETQHIAGTQNKDGHHIHSDYNPDSSPYHRYVQASWLTHPQSQAAGIPMRASHQPQSSSHVPPSFLPHPHPFMLPHLSSTPSHHPWPRQNAPAWSSLQTDGPWSWTAAAAGLPEALRGQLYKEPPTELMASPTVAQGSEISGASCSRSERCGGRRSSRLAQELDIKPVRLSSGHAESSESGRDSTQAIRERRRKEKRGRSQCTSSEKQSHSSEDSSRTSSAVIVASAAVAESSQRDVSSGKCKKRRQRSGVRVESLSTEKVLKEKNRNEGDESASQHSSEESGRETEESTGKDAGNSSAGDKSGECRREESGSICIQLQSKVGDEKQKQEIIISEQSSSEEEDEDDKHEEDLVGENKTEEQEDSLEGDDQDGDVEDEADEKDKCLKEKERDERKDEEDADEEEEKATEDKMEKECTVKDELKKDCDERSSASSQDEEDESEQDQTEEDEEGTEEEQGESEEEQMSDKEGESDSEESVTSQQEKRRRHIIPEEAAEDDEEKKVNKAGFSDGDSNDFSEDDDIENLLTPQEQRQKTEDKDLKPAEKLKVPDMKVVQAEDDRSTQITPQHSDSDEFDHFYD